MDATLPVGMLNTQASAAAAKEGLSRLAGLFKGSFLVRMESWNWQQCVSIGQAFDAPFVLFKLSLILFDCQQDVCMLFACSGNVIKPALIIFCSSFPMAGQPNTKAAKNPPSRPL
jgi:hypothetical protein